MRVKTTLDTSICASSSRCRSTRSARFGAPISAAQPSTALQMTAIASDPTRTACGDTPAGLKRHCDQLRSTREVAYIMLDVVPHETLGLRSCDEGQHADAKTSYLKHLVLGEELAIALDHEHCSGRA